MFSVRRSWRRPGLASARQDDRLHQRRVQISCIRGTCAISAGATSAISSSASTPIARRAAQGDVDRSLPRRNRPKCWLRYECVDAVAIFDEDTPRHHRCHSAATFWSRAPTGPPTPSSDAISSRRAADGSSAVPSSRATRRRDHCEDKNVVTSTSTSLGLISLLKERDLPQWHGSRAIAVGLTSSARRCACAGAAHAIPQGAVRCVVRPTAISKTRRPISVSSTGHRRSRVTTRWSAWCCRFRRLTEVGMRGMTPHPA